MKGFYKAVNPRTTYTFCTQCFSLNQRIMWLVRRQESSCCEHLKIILHTADSSVWTRATPNSNFTYRAGNNRYFKWKIIVGSRITERGATTF